MARADNSANLKRPNRKSGILEKYGSIVLGQVYAQEAFRNGKPDGSRYSIKELCEIGGCSNATMTQQWLPRWKEELDAGFAENCTLSFQVSPEDKEAWEAARSTLLKEKAIMEEELEDIEVSTSLIRSMIEKIEQHPDFVNSDFRELCSVVKTWSMLENARSKKRNDYVKIVDAFDKRNSARIQFENVEKFLAHEMRRISKEGKVASNPEELTRQEKNALGFTIEPDNTESLQLEE